VQLDGFGNRQILVWLTGRNPLTGLNLVQLREAILECLEDELEGRNPLTGLNLVQPLVVCSGCRGSRRFGSQSPYGAKPRATRAELLAVVVRDGVSQSPYGAKPRATAFYTREPREAEELLSQSPYGAKPRATRGSGPGRCVGPRGRRNPLTGLNLVQHFFYVTGVYDGATWVAIPLRG